ncbi:MAG: hypothetical protein GYB68_04535 [Chloroflexi bacterium]|nr:hypothetical protein [Chloroflexota bacterium]
MTDAVVLERPGQIALGRILLQVADFVLIAAINAYLAGTLAYLLLWRLGANPLGLAEFVVNFLPWLLSPFLIVTSISLIRRDWRRTALSGAVVIVFLGLYGGLLLPQAPPRCEEPCVPLRLMTLNSGIGINNADPEAMAQLISREQPDIVAFQELGRSQADVLERDLSDDYPYIAFFIEGERVTGTGVMSRYPIIDQQLIYIYTANSHMPHMRTVVEIEGQPVTVVSAHPLPPAFGGGYRSRTLPVMPELMTEIDADKHPIILMGDFNMTDQSRDYAWFIDQGFVDTFRETGWGLGLTFPTFSRSHRPLPPLVRIDYIWVTDSFLPQRAWVGDHVASDHLPVLADVLFVPR